MIEIITILLLCYILLFFTSIIIKDNSIVDVFWWLGFFIISSVLLYQNNITESSQLITYFLVLLWSLRISSSILSKKIKHRWEDKRYAKWREEWKYFYTRSFFQVYLLQMFLLILVATPLFVTFSSIWSNMFLNILWLIISLFGLWYETIADLQVQKYISSKDKKKNTIFTWWLWKYSRHPNYFWEILFWFWITLISLQFSLYWIIWLLTISTLLLFVSWIPLKEERYKGKDNYEKYSKETPLFIPKYINIKFK